MILIQNTVLPRNKETLRLCLIRFSRCLKFPAAAAACCIVLFNPGISADGVRSGLSLCASSVIPALFPFMVLTPLLSQTAAGISSDQQSRRTAFLSCFLLGMISGFPIGAVNVIDRYERGDFDRNTAERALGICNATGPAFLIGYAGVSVFHSARVGWMFYVIQLLSSLLTSLLFLDFKRWAAVPGCARTASPVRISFTEAVQAAVLKILTVCGFVVLFSVIRCFLHSLFSEPFFSQLPAPVVVLIIGFFEMTGGLADIADLSGSIPFALSFPIASFFIGFGGICVILQTAVFAKKAGLSMRFYLPEKLLCGLFCFLLSCIFTVFILP